MKKYKGIFFDWDGTAVISRKAPAEEAAAAMKGLLAKGVKLVIVSGTTYENIAGGKLEEYFTKEELEHLYLGLGRGAYNYRFEDGKPVVFADRIPDREGILQIHDAAYGIHRELLAAYGLETDVVFCRPNYCKIDLMAGSDRGEQLFMQLGSDSGCPRHKRRTWGTVGDCLQGRPEVRNRNESYLRREISGGRNQR